LSVRPISVHNLIVLIAGGRGARGRLQHAKFISNFALMRVKTGNGRIRRVVYQINRQWSKSNEKDGAPAFFAPSILRKTCFRKHVALRRCRNR
jgi:hypothetical protein